MDFNTPEEVAAFYGRSIQHELEAHWEQWKQPLLYRKVFGKLAGKAHLFRMPLRELAGVFEKEGFIKILNSPRGVQWVFVNPLPLDEDSIVSMLADTDHANETRAKESRKQSWKLKRKEAQHE